jgi:hypothetical protein
MLEVPADQTVRAFIADTELSDNLGGLSLTFRKQVAAASISEKVPMTPIGGMVLLALLLAGISVLTGRFRDTRRL